MPSINYKWLKTNIKDHAIKDYPIFIETGTFHGQTIFSLEKYFSKLHTIEIKKDLYENVKNRYKDDKINFHLGDSSIVLKHLCPTILLDTIFFLDGHWSCGNTGKGEKDVPLYEELYNITNFLEHKCIIIIDDCRLFGKGPNLGNCDQQWEDINLTQILLIVNKRLETYHFAPSKVAEEDRLILYLNKK